MDSGQTAEQRRPLVYDELRKLAAARMGQEPAVHMLQATALVHEAYIRWMDVDGTERGLRQESVLYR